jgi:hypothetical protein
MAAEEGSPVIFTSLYQSIWCHISKGCNLHILLLFIIFQDFTETKSNKILLDDWMHIGERVLTDHHALRTHVMPTEKVNEYSDSAVFSKSTHS